MKNQFTILLSLAAALVCAAPRPCFAAPAEKSDGNKTLILTQIGDNTGQSTCFINRRGIKITFDGSKAFLVARAPEWKVMFCNETNKKAVSMSLEAWLEHIFQVSYASNDWDRYILELRKKYDLKRFGRPMTRYLIAGTRDKAGQLIESVNARDADYLVLHTDLVAEQACHILQKTLSNPKVSGVPIEFTNHGKTITVKGYARDMGGLDHWLTTLNIREAQVSPKFFAYTSGLSMIKSEVDVMNDNKRKKQIDDVIEDLMPTH